MQEFVLSDLADDIGRSASLSILLEVSGFPKPGNVHRTKDFSKTRYEHFLCSGVAITPAMTTLALNGALLGLKRLTEGEVELGKHILKAISDTQRWQHGGNTNLGSVLLLAPLCVAAGAASSSGMMTVGGIRQEADRVMRGTTPKDAVNVYEAIRVARPGGLRAVPELDVNSEASRDEIIQRNASLFKVFEISAPWDAISKELVTGMRVTFEVGYPAFTKTFEDTQDINTATVHTYLTILSRETDTLILRKGGESAAQGISKRAKEIIEAGGLTSNRGKKMIQSLDDDLSKEDGKLNPGTTADLTCSSIMVALLEGWRP
ncbi:MAG: triphosphoribosyl-dephospho-CoA synthase [Promethearchaeati archaeon SRVP18_Atabeyarchaeia-1]